MTAAAYAFVISVSLFAGKNGINPRQDWVRTVPADIRTRYLLDGKCIAYGHVATFRFDLLLHMWFDMWRARRKFHLLSQLLFYLPFLITYSDDNFKQMLS